MRLKPRRILVSLVIVIIFIMGRRYFPILLEKRQSSSDQMLSEDNGSIIKDQYAFAKFNISSGSKKVDWHNYEQQKKDSNRIGPGEQGKPVLPQKLEKGSSAYHDNGFNIMVSDRISLDRSLPDIRVSQCRNRKYLAKLPTASIIIPFHNEGWSTLMRSIHSIMNRTPPQLLHEIILVDDFSSMGHLGSKLDDELSKFPKVNLIRLKKREGLIRARLSGVDVATGEVIVILDSHIEVTNNWLPPLLEPIAMDRRTITCPNIDVIHNEDFHYETQAGDAMRGAFDWELYYKRIPIPSDKKPKDPSDPFEDPVMAGGLFAANRLYFDEIGRYDPGLEIWGGEQYELSFKVWMCGGRILDSPCSRVGHIYRKFVPYKSIGGGVNRNYKRVAEVWMDEYKEYLYKKRPNMRHIDMGDISQQLKLRERLGCKSFNWFMTEVAPDIIKYYPAQLPDPAAWGSLRNEASGECVDGARGGSGGKLQVRTCNPGADQSFLLTWSEDIRPGADMYQARSVCLDGQAAGRQVTLYPCHQMHGNQLWKFQSEQGRLYHVQTKSCAASKSLSPDAPSILILEPCDDHERRQRWTWQHVDADKLARFNTRLDRAA